MPDSRIFEGKTTNEAIEKGLKELKVSKNDVEIKVIKDEDKRSFFDILAPRVVKVEIKLKEKREEVKHEVDKEKKKEIIEIDKNAREIVKQEKDKKINIDDFIETEFRTKKAILDLEYKEEITKQKENYDKLFQKRKMEIDSQIHLKITEIERSYKNKEKDIIKNIIDSIKRGEN